MMQAIWNGAVLAESDQTIIVEGNHYFPAADVARGDGSRFSRVRPHARGGLGEVSVARDRELGREVALKEILGRFADDTHSRSRFVLEAEVTGALEHPGVVPVYGLGQFEDGRPYYAMRFVQGDSLRKAIGRFHKEGGIRANGRQLRSLLGQLVDVCNAIAYAHDRGVLHRDLKPDNVMLGRYGETLVVDWGLAKVMGREEPSAVGRDESATSGDVLSGSGGSATRDGIAIGTPAYMPPEQARGDLSEIGPAADVYSLGATLYHILTGHPPATGATVAEILERVKRGDIASAREVDDRVPAALSAIAARAMATAPQARYVSAAALADDVDRWLADEPVDAYEDPPRVRLQRWARRHPRTVTATAATLLLGLSGAAAIATVVAGKNAELATANDSLRSANEAEQRAAAEAVAAQAEAEQERNEAQAARAAADEQRLLAQDKAAEAEEVLGYFEQTVLASARPEGLPDSLGRDARVRDAIEQARTKLPDAFAQRPAVRASVGSVIGNTLMTLGEYGPAIESLEAASDTALEALGPDDPRTLLVRYRLGRAYGMGGKSQQALETLEDVRSRRRAAGGEDDRETLRADRAYADELARAGRPAEAVPILQSVFDRLRAQFGEDSEQVGSAKLGLSTALIQSGRHDEAIPLLEDQIRRMPEGEEFSRMLVRQRLGVAMLTSGRVSEAADVLAEVQEEMTRILGPEHNDTLTNAVNLAVVRSKLDDPAGAAEILEDIIPIQEQTIGSGHPNAVVTKMIYGRSLTHAGRAAEAIDVLRRGREAAATTIGEANPISGQLAAWHAAALAETDQADAALESLAAADAAVTEEMPQANDVAIARGLVALALGRAGRAEEATPLKNAAAEKLRGLPDVSGYPAEVLQRLDAPAAE